MNSISAIQRSPFVDGRIQMFTLDLRTCREERRDVPELFIAEWQWDDSNLQHLAERHPELARRSRRIVRQVWHTEPRYRANKAGRAATHQMIGPDYGGAMWTFCIMEVFGDPGLWRVIIGWAAEQAEIDWYRRQR